MRLRPYIANWDFGSIRNWITDEREHAFWCAGSMDYPIDEQSFARFLAEQAERFGGAPFVATTDAGVPVGLFTYELDPAANEGKLRIVLVDPAERGKGVGKEMLRLALRYAFEISKADAVQLNVFSANVGAMKCYKGAGFTERRVEPDALQFGEESWDRINMVRQKEQIGKKE